MSVGPAQPAHVGVAAHDARGAARGVEQDGIERPAVPPGVGRAGVGGRCGPSGPGAPGCRPPGAGASGSLSRASTSRSASSSRWQSCPPGAAQASSTRAPAGRPSPITSGAARWAAASCTETSPSANPGQLVHRRRPGEHARRAAPTTVPREAGQARPLRRRRRRVGRAGRSPAASSAGGRCRRRARRRQRRRPVGPQPFDPPLRVVQCGDGVLVGGLDHGAPCSRRKRRSTALMNGALALARLFRGLDGLVHEGVRRVLAPLLSSGHSSARAVVSSASTSGGGLRREGHGARAWRWPAAGAAPGR